MSDIRDLAIADCKYGLSLGEVALNEHIEHWTGFAAKAHKACFDKDEYHYFVAMKDIKNKLVTENCIIK